MYIIWIFLWKTQTHCRVDDVWHCWSLLGQSDGRAFAVLELMQRQNYIFLGENCKCYCSTLGRPAASAQPHCNTVIIWGDYGRRMGCGMPLIALLCGLWINYIEQTIVICQLHSILYEYINILVINILIEEKYGRIPIYVEYTWTSADYVWLYFIY